MSRLTHTILFNKKIICHDQRGVSFYNETTGKTAIAISLESVLPKKCLLYIVDWEVDPRRGEIIKWLYDGVGSYQDEKKVLMPSQELIMINCLASDIVNTEELKAIKPDLDLSYLL